MRPADPDRSINGMFSFTPDAGSIVGESAAVRGVWICEAVWVTHAGGFGKHVAEWMVQGEPSIDMAEADANRFYPFMTTPPYVLERGKQQYREVYDILHPRQQMARPRKLRLTPFYARHEELGAEFVTGAGWERPEWFEANAALVPAGAPWVHRDGWAGTFWSPIEGAEHLATRSSARAVRPDAVREVRRRGARRARVPRTDLREPDRPAGGLDRVHGDAHARGRDPVRPHDRPQGRGAVPRGDRRRQRASTTSPGCGGRSARTNGFGSPSARGRCSRSACGARTRARSSTASPTPTSATRPSPT